MIHNAPTRNPKTNKLEQNNKTPNLINKKLSCCLAPNCPAPVATPSDCEPTRMS